MNFVHGHYREPEQQQQKKKHFVKKNIFEEEKKKTVAHGINSIVSSFFFCRITIDSLNWPDQNEHFVIFVFSNSHLSSLRILKKKKNVFFFRSANTHIAHTHPSHSPFQNDSFEWINLLIAKIGDEPNVSTAQVVEKRPNSSIRAIRRTCK